MNIHFTDIEQTFNVSRNARSIYVKCVALTYIFFQSESCYNAAGLPLDFNALWLLTQISYIRGLLSEWCNPFLYLRPYLSFYHDLGNCLPSKCFGMTISAPAAPPRWNARYKTCPSSTTSTCFRYRVKGPN